MLYMNSFMYRSPLQVSECSFASKLVHSNAIVIQGRSFDVN